MIKHVLGYILSTFMLVGYYLILWFGLCGIIATGPAVILGLIMAIAAIISYSMICTIGDHVKFTACLPHIRFGIILHIFWAAIAICNAFLYLVLRVLGVIRLPATSGLVITLFMIFSAAAIIAGITVNDLNLD